MRGALASMVVLGVVLSGSSATTQSAAPAPTAARESVIAIVASIERTLTGAAADMPEDKYDFAPTDGAFRGVRHFGRQIKHAAAVHHLVAATILGERVTADMSDERGPDAVRTKAEVQRYLSESFAALRRAALTVDDANAFAPIKSPFGATLTSRVGLIVQATSHSWNHYGQIVPYLRMNGIVPSRTP